MKTSGLPVSRTELGPLTGPDVPRASIPAASGVALLLVWLWLGTLPLHAAEVYDCEMLAPNQWLQGQDGWRVLPGLGEIELVPANTQDNATLVLRHRHVVPTDFPAFASRTNDARFSFVAFTGTETNAIIEFEATGEFVALFALGCDLDGDGLLTAEAGELGPAFGISDRRFRIQEANLGASHDDNFNLGGGDANSGNDYYRLQLRMNLTANDGDGLGTLAFQNLTDSDTAFHTVPGVRNQPLGLRRLPAEARPARWNAMWVQLHSNGNSIPIADNFIPNPKGVLIVELIPDGEAWLLRWRGGVGPYQVQRRTSLTVGDWENVGSPTPLLTATMSLPGPMGFFRISQP